MIDLKKPIVTTIEELVKDIPGWTPLDQLYSLFNLVFLNPTVKGDILEIGSWCGRSSSVLALAARMAGNAKVWCIDLFPQKSDWHQNPDGSYSMLVTIDGKQYGGYQQQTVWKEPFEKDIAPLYHDKNGILDIFNDTMNRNNFQDIVHPIRGDSMKVDQLVNKGVKCKLAFVDGDHSFEAVCQDIDNVEKVLLPGGWICFDDAFSYYDGVNQAIEQRIVKSPQYDSYQQLTRKFFAARRKEA